MGTCVFYIDEAGTPHKHMIPIKGGTNPIFTLAAVAFPLELWRARDREFLDLKRHYFPGKMGNPVVRDEHVEIKGNELTAPRNASSRSRHAFLKNVITFIQNHSGMCFGITVLKNPVTPTSPESIYTHALQLLVERFNIFIDKHPDYDNGILICDSRSKGLNGNDNLTVIKSHMSYIFGHSQGKTYTNILEAPLFADSRFCAGVQIADIYASLLYTTQYEFHFSRDPNAASNGFLNYSHMCKYWPLIKPMGFKSASSSEATLNMGHGL